MLSNLTEVCWGVMISFTTIWHIPISSGDLLLLILLLLHSSYKIHVPPTFRNFSGFSKQKIFPEFFFFTPSLKHFNILGESSWLPQLPILNSTEDSYPDIYTAKYVKTVSQFGSFIEVRVGKQTQEIPIFVRMLDKDSRWGLDNGLESLLVTLLQVSDKIYTFLGGKGRLILPLTLSSPNLIVNFFF